MESATSLRWTARAMAALDIGSGKKSGSWRRTCRVVWCCWECRRTEAVPRCVWSVKLLEEWRVRWVMEEAKRRRMSF